jgi:hypothetical protein
MDREIAHTIKFIVNSILPDSRVLLFGSQARGNFDADSDYDLMVITQKTFSSKERMDWRSKINKTLVYALNAPFDV